MVISTLKEDGAIYSNTIPKDAVLIGAVTTNQKHGALIKFEKTGIYARLNAGCVTALNQREVKQCLNN